MHPVDYNTIDNIKLIDSKQHRYTFHTTNLNKQSVQDIHKLNSAIHILPRLSPELLLHDLQLTDEFEVSSIHMAIVSVHGIFNKTCSFLLTEETKTLAIVMLQI